MTLLMISLPLSRAPSDVLLSNDWFIFIARFSKDSFLNFRCYHELDLVNISEQIQNKKARERDDVEN